MATINILDTYKAVLKEIGLGTCNYQASPEIQLHLLMSENNH